MVEPFISVIILAHDRRAYLFDAVNSVLSQQIPRDIYEVLVVKYELDNDKEVDKKLESLGIRVINTKEVSLGAKIAIGAMEAKGDVLAFLEDDDLFTDQKLSRIYSVFSTNNKIGYYHNEMKFFDIDKNQPIEKEEKFRKRMLARFRKNFKNGIMIKGIEFWKKIPILGCAFFGFNNSSIAVRRDVILNFTEVYKFSQLNHAIDFLHFLLSLELNYLTAIDEQELTIYRVHSHSTMMRKFSSYEKFIENNIIISKTQLHNLSLISKFYNIYNISSLLATFYSFIEFSEISYEEMLDSKTNKYINKLAIVLKLLKNDKSYFISPGLLLSYVYYLTPTLVRMKIGEYMYKH
ncbi:glycosyltransferase [Acidianus sulfidivorans JP7]|nr:glycosyltransferase family 2 protein [Acidianus sulfidivorans]AWR96241.2 glycosyltransferase [Acidianus sulfidivorans JP7]